MKIVIIGGGKVGFTLAKQLVKENHSITLVDRCWERLEQIAGMLDIKTLCGNGASLSVLKEAGAPDSDLLIAVTHMDELNMLCCIVARKLGCKNTIARVRSAEYNEQMFLLKDELGLSMTVNPELIAAKEIFRLTQIPGFLKRDTFAKGRVEIVETVVLSGDPLDGLEMSDIPQQLKMRALVCAIQRGEKAYIPNGQFVLQPGDKIYVTAASSELGLLMEGMGIPRHKVRDVMIIGGSRIARHLAEMLKKNHVRTRLLECNRNKAELLAEQLPGTMIIHADGTDQNILRAENIEAMDSVITLTDMDEENLVVSLFASRVGVRQVITKLNRTEYTDLFRGQGLDCVVSPKQLCAQVIVRYVRAMQNLDGSSVLTVHHLADGQVEALEFDVTEKTKHRGVPLRKLPLKPGMLLACITRMGKSLIPGGDDTLETGDTVIVVANAERVILDLNDIFRAEKKESMG